MSRQINYRVRATDSKRNYFVIQQRFRLLWLIPIWCNTTTKGCNYGRLSKIATKMNRGS